MTHTPADPRLTCRVQDTHAHLVPAQPVAKALCVTLAIVLLSHAAVSEETPINVAVLPPAQEPFSILGEQVYVAARAAGQDLLSSGSSIVIHNIAAQWSPDDPDTWASIHDQLTAANIDFLIGGYTPRESAALGALASEWRLPTVLLTPASRSDGSSGESDLVLEMGDTSDRVYTSSVVDWVNQYVTNPEDQQRATIAILFDFEDDASYRFGTDITPQALSESRLTLAEVPFSRPGGPNYTFAIDQVRRLDPAGVIVSGSPLDAANLIRKIGTELDVPIFLAAPEGWSGQTAAFVQGTYSPTAGDSPSPPSSIYYGSQVWSDPTKENIQLALRLREELGWSNGAISSQAMKAYDAVRVIDEVRSMESATESKPWALNQEIAGYTTNFSIEGNRLTAPYRLTELNADSLSLVSP